MRRIIGWAAVALLTTVGSPIAQEATNSAMPTTAHVMVDPASLKWGAPPPVFEQKGATFALLSGDPSQPGLYLVRLKMAPGYRINPHWHPTDEHVTVVSGTFSVGMGEKFDKAAMKDLPAGGYVLLPAEMRHYAMAKTACVVQVHGMGPFTLTYVDPANDPSKHMSEATK